MLESLAASAYTFFLTAFGSPTRDPAYADATQTPTLRVAADFLPPTRENLRVFKKPTEVFGAVPTFRGLSYYCVTNVRCPQCLEKLTFELAKAQRLSLRTRRRMSWPMFSKTGTLWSQKSTRWLKIVPLPSHRISV